ncbi:peptidylprolyl isomerase [Maribellus sp. YY47]|uniref:peptidylprolyl isomerase n=1 Tax=Maribellus sp. YY47 TaxID=2929486 RepID=UPI0020014120|nr:peptidylprolyl isomerase [Maribellus sp. YY47]MCK3684087.1 peptidylprolyl isomerase [Maribellus sp. YY47]
MYRVIFSCLLILSAALHLRAQDAEILLTIDGKPVSKAEFEYIYQKNNTNVYADSDKKTPEEYLPLFIDFKLKVTEAERLKMDTSAAFINELAGYRKEIAEHYLTDINFEDQLVHEMYRRMTQEVDASHILLRLDKNASPEEEQKTLNKIRKIRQELLDGRDFGEAAVEYSEDPSAKDNHGNLGYFSAFMMVYPFENAAYNTPVGEISEPVRSSFGYHILKVNDIRLNQGEILVAHIMKNVPADASAETKNEIKTQIDSIYEQVKNGADFAELAKKESNDRRSAVKGGEMPWFSRGRIIPQFANPAFDLKNVGDISKPVETPFGYHVIKKLDQKPVPSFDDVKKEIETRIAHDPERRTSSEKAFVEKLKMEYNFSENNSAKQSLEGKNVDSENIPADLTLFIIDNKNYTTADLQKWLSAKNIKTGFILSNYDEWVNAEIIALEDSKLEDKYSDFRYLMREYHDGILLFNISQEKIWNFASEDSLGLQGFYNEMKEKPMWKDRFKGSIISCKNEEIRDQADNLFGADLTVEEVAEHLNTNGEVFTVETGAWEEGTNPVVDYYVWNGSEPENFNSLTTFIRGDKVGPEPKLLDEARGLYISDYQQYLEKNWLKELHARYKVKVNRKVLKTIDGV